MAQRIYLATPYTHPDPQVREARFFTVSERANALMREGFLVFSPITHGHLIGVMGGLPGDFTFWKEHCLSFLHHWAEAVYVLAQPGWQDSVGVAAEIEEAQRIGLPVSFIS